MLWSMELQRVRHDLETEQPYLAKRETFFPSIVSDMHLST